MTFYEIWKSKRRVIPPEYGMTFMGAILTFLMVMLICVLVLIIIRCILGVRKEYCNPDIISSHDDHDQLKISIEDFEPGSRITQPPTFLTVQYSVRKKYRTTY